MKGAPGDDAVGSFLVPSGNSAGLGGVRDRAGEGRPRGSLMTRRS